jgi:hypothetical protein
MENAKNRSPFIFDQPLNLGDPQIIGIVIAVFTVLITIGKIIYICMWKLCLTV